jgi:dynein assembly factor with WDR repeat domains 1
MGCGKWRLFEYFEVIKNLISGHTSEVLDVAYSLNGKKMATTSADGTARIIDSETLLCDFELRGHSDEISRV